MEIQIKMKKYIFSLLIAAGLLTSCESFLDINQDPDKPTDEYMTLAYRLPAALYNTASQEAIQLNELGSFWGGYWGVNIEGKASYSSLQLYNGTDLMSKRDAQYPIWENGYVYANYYQLIKNQAESEGSKVYGGVSRIMIAWHILRLADVYGDIPFDQAFDSDKYPLPQYENGIEVYQKSIDMLTEAIALLNAERSVAEPKPTADDIIFGGDVTKWIQFANTIKLRALLRQSEVEGQSAYIAGEIAKIVAEGHGFLSTSALVNPGFSSTKLNPYWGRYYHDASNKETTAHINIRPTEYILDQYKALNDPRLSNLYVEVEGDYRGVIFGYNGDDARYGKTKTSALKGPNENNSNSAALLKSATQPLVLMSNSESYFLQAEAIQRGWLKGNARDLYVKGIEASFSYMGVAATEASAYLSQSNVAYNGSIAQIILQKWLAMNSVSGFEAWSDYRRLHMPDFPNSVAVSDASIRPHRLLYPESENQTNIKQVKARNITDITKDRIWWDVNK